MAFLFEFVGQFSKDLANLGEKIEGVMFREPSAAMVDARKYCEHLVKMISKEEDLEAFSNEEELDEFLRKVYN